MVSQAMMGHREESPVIGRFLTSLGLNALVQSADRLLEASGAIDAAPRILRKSPLLGVIASAVSASRTGALPVSDSIGAESKVPGYAVGLEKSGALPNRERRSEAARR